MTETLGDEPLIDAETRLTRPPTEIEDVVYAIVELKGEVSHLTKTLITMTEDMRRCDADHEQRLRLIETALHAFDQITALGVVAEANANRITVLEHAILSTAERRGGWRDAISVILAFAAGLIAAGASVWAIFGGH